LLHAAIAPFFDPTLDSRFAAANALPEDIDTWFKALPAYVEAAESIGVLHAAATSAVDELIEAVDHHVEEVRSAALDADDAPTLDPIEIEPELNVEPPEPLFRSADDFLTSTRKLIARRDGGEGKAEDDDSDDDGGAE
jgi:hypothetical protein